MRTHPLVMEGVDLPLSAEQHRMRTATLAMHGCSLGLLTLLLIVIRVNRLKRSEILISLFLAFAVNDCFDLLTARHLWDPPWALCFASASLTVAGTALCTTAVLSLVLHTWALLRERTGGKVLSEPKLKPILLALPWVVFLAILLLETISIGVRPENLSLSLMTCYAQSLSVDIAHGAAFLSVFLCMIFDIWSIKMVWSNFASFRRAGESGTSTVTDPAAVAASPLLHLVVVARPGFNLAFTIRVLVFGGAVIAAVGAAIVIIVYPKSHIPALFQSTIGLLAFLIFGTQRDVLKAVRPTVPSFLRSMISPSAAEHRPSPSSDSPRPLPFFHLSRLLRLVAPTCDPVLPSTTAPSSSPPPTDPAWRAPPIRRRPKVFTRQSSDGLGIDGVSQPPTYADGPRSSATRPPGKGGDEGPSPALSDISFGEMLRSGGRVKRRSESPRRVERAPRPPEDLQEIGRKGSETSGTSGASKVTFETSDEGEEGIPLGLCILEKAQSQGEGERPSQGREEDDRGVI